MFAIVDLDWWAVCPELVVEGADGDKRSFALSDIVYRTMINDLVTAQ